MSDTPSPSLAALPQGLIDLGALSATNPTDARQVVGIADMDFVEMLRQKVFQATTKYARDGVQFGVSLTVVPSSEPGGFMPVLVTVLTMPSPLVAQERLVFNLLSFDLLQPQAEVQRVVDEGVEALRRTASQILSQGSPS